MKGTQEASEAERAATAKADECKERNQLYRKIIDVNLPLPEALDRQELRAWYEEYKDADGDALDLESAVVRQNLQGEIDEAALEACITALASSISVSSGFCDDCQYLFDTWPDLSDSKPNAYCPPEDFPFPGVGAIWKHAILRDCHTLVVEAACRKGCRMCAFLLQTLKTGNVITAFRKIEARMAYLGIIQTATLAVQNWVYGPSQMIWINLPGKSNGHCNFGTAVDTKIYCDALSNTD